MFRFFIRTSVGRCQVWEEAGSQIFGMSGEEFWQSHQTQGELQAVCKSIMSGR